jgi:hypothetical protein
VSFATIAWKRPGPTNGGYAAPEGSDIPHMRPRTGKRGADRQLVKLLCEALDDLSACTCTFWACKGPSRQQAMATCRKCYAMRTVATVMESLRAREPVKAKESSS